MRGETYTLGEILSPSDWVECHDLIIDIFYKFIVPIINQKAVEIVHGMEDGNGNVDLDRFFDYDASKSAKRLRRRNGLGSIQNMSTRVTISPDHIIHFEWNDNTPPQKPIGKNSEWEQNIFLIDLVSGTIDNRDALPGAKVKALIPNIFNERQDYPWARPNHREYRQQMNQYLNSEEFSNTIIKILETELKDFASEKLEVYIINKFIKILKKRGII